MGAPLILTTALSSPAVGAVRAGGAGLARRVSFLAVPGPGSERADVVGMAVPDLVERLLRIEVSALCDADKGMPVVDPAIRAMVADVRMAGPALTVVAEDDHLPVFSALAAAAPGDVLVIVTGGGRRAVLGELFATDARRRGLAGIVIDGYCRDVQGLRRVGLPVFARGTNPSSGTTLARSALGRPVLCGGVLVSAGDLVFADDDGVVIAPPARVGAALDVGEAIGFSEQLILERVRDGEALHGLTSYAEHVERLDVGQESRLEFRVDADAR